MKSINPATGDIIKEYPEHDQAHIDEVISCAENRFSQWKKTSFESRAKLLRDVADILDERRLQLAQLMTDEMGKLLSSAKSEVEKCAWVCRYYADHGAEHLTPKQILTDAKLSYVSYEPLGIILAVMPWNFPLWQVFRFAAPTLMAGNVAILKHASNVSGSAEAITQVFEDAGAPEGLFTHLWIDSDATHEVLERDVVRGVSLTGSLRAGQAIAATAGKQCKPVLLELGGSDPFIVLDDADIERAVDIGMKSRFLNNGQSCIAAKRFIIHADIYDAFVQRVKDHVELMNIGDPNDDETDLGPIARDDLRDGLHEQVQKTISQGARCISGGKILNDRKGYYYPPTVLIDVEPGMEGFDEELFGPVVTITKAKDEQDAITLANQTVYGLGASLWTTDMNRALSLVPQIEAGNVFVNGMVKSDPRLPFGGIKKSGTGRELAQDGILAFVNIKTVWMA